MFSCHLATEDELRYYGHILLVYRYTGIQVYRYTGRYTGIKAYRQTGIKVYRHTCTHVYRYASTQVYRHTGKHLAGEVELGHDSHSLQVHRERP